MKLALKLNKLNMLLFFNKKHIIAKTIFRKMNVLTLAATRASTTLLFYKKYMQKLNISQ